MIFRQLFDPSSWTYTYLLASGGEAVLIDPVFEQHARDVALIRELGLRLRYTLETHVHADHATGAWLMKQALGSEIAVSKHGGADGVDVAVDEGDTISFGDSTLMVRATPGHTNSCVSYVLADESMAFTGDCLMIRGAGRTDFQQGDPAALFRSIRNTIFKLPDECLLYPGHDYRGRTVTTVAEEREHNPRVGGTADEGDFVGYMTNLGLPHPKKMDIAVPANLRCGRPEEDAMPPAANWGPIVTTYAGILEVEPEWVSANRAELTLLDVREPAELEGPELGCVEGVLNIPLGQLRDRISEVPTDQPVVTVCRSGRRSAQAMVILAKAGVERVANLPGGMIRWRELKLATKLP